MEHAVIWTGAFAVHEDVVETIRTGWFLHRGSRTEVTDPCARGDPEVAGAKSSRATYLRLQEQHALVFGTDGLTILEGFWYEVRSIRIRRCTTCAFARGLEPPALQAANGYKLA